jgi:hypothetical protein
MKAMDQPIWEAAVKWRTQVASGAANAKHSAGTLRTAPNSAVNSTRESSGCAEFQAITSATPHCTANSSRNVRCVPSVSCATTS